MIPAVIDITIYQGSTFRKKFQWQTGTPAVPVDLTGATAAMQIRPSHNNPTPAATLTTANGGITIAPTSPWEIEVIISPAVSSAMALKKGVYDLEITQGTEVTRIVMGEVILSQEVTKDV